MNGLIKKFKFKNKKTFRFGISFFVFCFFVFLPYFKIEAAINKQISYQGKLTDNLDVAVSDGNYNMRFQLCTASDCSGGGDPVWTESSCYSPDSGLTCDGTGTDQRVSISKGIFSTLLGSITSLNSVDFNQTLYLQIQVGGSGATPSWETLSPAKLLGAVPSAITADQLDGLDSTSFLRSDEEDTMSASSSSTLLTLDQDGSGDILNVIGGSTEVFTILSDGKIGVGSTSPNAKLTIEHNANVNTATGISGYPLLIRSSSNLDGWGTSLAFLHSSDTSDLTTPGAAIVHRKTNAWSQGGLDFFVKTTAFQTAELTNALTISDQAFTGIGTSSPDRRLDILDNTNPQLRLAHTDSSVFTDFQTTSSGHLYINPSGGNVGIGTNTPGTTLDILKTGTLPTGNPAFPLRISSGSGTTPGMIFERNDGEGRFVSLWTGSSGSVLGFSSNLGRLAIGSYDIANKYSLGFPDTEAISVLNGGKVGINTKTPRQPLDVKGKIRSTYIDDSIFTDLETNPSGNLIISPSGGNVGIGMTEPDRKLDVLDGTNPQMRLTHTDGSVFTDFQTDASGYLMINSTGNKVFLSDYTSNGLLKTVGSNGELVVATAGTDYFSASSQVDHDSTTNYNANEHIDWTGASAGTIHASNYVDNNTTTFLGLTDTMNSFTAGSVLFTSGSAVTQDNTNFFWDDTNNYLGLGTATPRRRLDILDGGGSAQLRLTYTDNTVYADLKTDSSGYLNILTSGGKSNFYDSAGTNYLTVEHDGTNGVISTNTGEVQIGSSGDFITDSGVNVGLGTDTTNELLTVNGRMSLAETTAPTQTTGYGKLYVKSSDGKLYFMDSSGNETDLLVGGGGSATFLGLTDTMNSFTAGSVLFTSGSAVTQDNTNFFWDDTNNYLGLGTNTPSYVLTIDGADGETDLLSVSSYGTDIFKVKSTQTVISNPVAMTSSGDMAIAYDLNMTNSTAGSIKFNGPGYVQTDSSWQNLDLTLSASGTGEVIVADNFLVEGSSEGFVSKIRNTNTGAAVDGLYIYLEGDGSLTSTNSYIAFGNASDDTAGHIYASDNSTVTYATTGGDYAEFYFTQDKSIEAGEVVCVDVSIDNAIKKCEHLADGNLMGVVSTSPGFLGMDEKRKRDNDNYKMVAMVGQVPTKITGENGPIRPGDSLTSSSINGFAMKASAGDSTVGVALESFLGNRKTDQGVINVMISRKNKSVTVAQIEQEVADRIAQMELQDEIEIILARSSKISQINESLLDYSFKIASNQEGIGSLMNSFKSISGYRNNMDLIGLNVNDLNVKLRDISSKVASLEEGYRYEKISLDWYDFQVENDDYFTNLANPEFLEEGEIHGFYEANGDFSEISFNQEQGIDLSNFELEEGGYLVFDLFIENFNHLNDLHAEIGNQMDTRELEWQLADFPYLVSGWNKIRLRLTDGRVSGEINWEDLNYFRVFFSFSDRSGVGLKNISLELKEKTDLSHFVLENPLFEESVNIASEEGKREALVFLAGKISQLEENYSVAGQSLLSDRISSVENLVENLNDFNELVVDQLSDHSQRISDLENHLAMGGLINFNSEVKIDSDGTASFKKIKASKIETDAILVEEYMIKSPVTEEKKALTGSVSIGKGQKQVFIENERVNRGARLIVTPVGNSPVSWIISKKETGVGFEITLEEPVDFEVSFDYWIVGINE